jgi:penicillin-binding protein A
MSEISMRSGPDGSRAGSRGIAGGITRTGVTLSLAFAILAGGAGYWQVFRAADLSVRSDNPAVIAAARNAVRGLIYDRTGAVLASNKRDANGEPYRAYADPALSGVIGYASRLFGSAGLERAYDAQLTGAAGADPVRDMLRKFQSNPSDPQSLHTSLSLSLQRLAVRLLGGDRGAVVMLDPRSGQVLVLASTPTFNASAVANPATSRATFTALKADQSLPLLPRAVQGEYVPGSVFKIVTSMAALGSGAITPATTYKQQPGAEETGLLVSGYRVMDGHHRFTGSKALDYAEAIEVSCNIYFALTGLRTGGQALHSYADQLGFDASLPFDLPTAVSQVTNGGGSFGGGYKDDVELANAAYGQAETLVTPLQMALVAATVANGGVTMRPYLVSSEVGKQSGTLTIDPQEIRRVVSPEVAATIASAMELAVEGDWGRLFTTGAAVPGVQTAGKTGTAQLGGSGEPHSWFIGFAPVDKPQIAIAVIVERGGHGAVRAAPIAGQLMQAFFAGQK